MTLKNIFRFSYVDLFQGYFKCFFNGHCKIDMYSRRTCPSCRLAKCFASGMQIEMLRSFRKTTLKKRNQSQQVRFFNIFTFLSLISINNCSYQL